MLKRVTVGKIRTAHGIRGEVKVEPLTDFPQRFRPGIRLFIDQGQGERAVTIEKARPHGPLLLVKFKEIQGREEALALRGCLLQVEPWEVEPLPEDHYYIFQLIGCLVYTVEGEYLGILTEVLRTRAHDVYVVTSPEGKEILLPARKELLPLIDVARRRIEVILPPGLLE
ncbi:MAG TPA: 16S rRNA processing protein RimM [Moorella mulderi]|nr:16S rRNA processing protein RimM [Moorella mulderi]